MCGKITNFPYKYGYPVVLLQIVKLIRGYLQKHRHETEVRLLRAAPGLLWTLISWVHGGTDGERTRTPRRPGPASEVPPAGKTEVRASEASGKT